MGDNHYEMETRGLLNDGYFATWGVDHSAGKYISLKWFEMPSDGNFPDTSRVFNDAMTRIRPLERAMGPGGNGLQALVDTFPEKKTIITCREESTAGGQRIRVTVELPDHGIPGPWTRALLNPAKRYMVEESTVMGPDGTELTSKLKLSEVSKGVWFPKEIVMNTTASNEKSRIRSERFQLLDFKLGGCYPEASFTLPALNTPPKLLKTYGVSRYYLDGRVEVTTLDGRDHLKSKKHASLSRAEE